MLVNNWVCDLCAVSCPRCTGKGPQVRSGRSQSDWWCAASGRAESWIWCSGSLAVILHCNRALRGFSFLFYLGYSLKRDCATCPFLLHNKVFFSLITGGILMWNWPVQKHTSECVDVWWSTAVLHYNTLSVCEKTVLEKRTTHLGVLSSLKVCWVPGPWESGLSFWHHFLKASFHR